MRTLALLSASFLLAAPQVAAAQNAGPCLTPAELSAFATFALPGAISGVNRACATTLPATAYLRKNGTDLVARYGAAKVKAWPQAKSVFVKMATTKDQSASKMLSTMPDETLLQFTDAAIAGMVSGEIKPDTCPTIDKVLGLLAPLPPESTGELVAVLIGVGSKASQGKFGSLTLCKD